MGELSTIYDVGRLLGLELPKLKKHGRCPFRDHKKAPKPFVMFEARSSGKVLWKCHACDPPDNCGDAVALYAKLTHIDRRLAWRELRDKGFVFSEDDARRDSERWARRAQDAIPVKGRSEGKIIPLDMRVWRGFMKNGTGAVERFAKQRGLDPKLLVESDVVEVERNAVGFGYRDPETTVPCRVKVRVIDKKVFWIEPRGDDGKALSPLYLAHDINGYKGVLITEGEVDALTVRAMGQHNVVSLPDGAESAGRVDIEPLMRYGIVLVSFDADPPGEKAYEVMRERLHRWDKVSVRVTWSDGEHKFKDANEARMAGMSPEWFHKCLKRSMEEGLGYIIEI